MKVRYCMHCYLDLGEAEKGVKVDGDIYHQRCWDLLDKEHALIESHLPVAVKDDEFKCELGCPKPHKRNPFGTGGDTKVG